MSNPGPSGPQQYPPPGQPGQPYQGQQYPWPAAPPPLPAKKRGPGCLTVSLAIIVGLVVGGLILAAMGGNDDKDKDAKSSGGKAPSQEVFKVGDTAHTGDFDVTVHSVRDPYSPANEFDLKPAAGKRFVAVEMTMTNTSDKPLPLSTAIGVEVLDQADRLGTFSLAGASELPRLDAPTVAPGEPRRGWYVAEVAQDATGLKLRVKGNVTATGSVFALS